jgi:hypothetical protein
MGFYRQRNFGSFDPSKQLVAGRQMTLHDDELTGGDPISMDVDEGTRRRLWMVEHAHYEEDYRPTPELQTEEEEDTKGVEFTHIGGGQYEVTAPWLTEPVKVKGKAAAEAKAAELREQAPPPEEEASTEERVNDATEEEVTEEGGEGSVTEE